MFRALCDTLLARFGLDPYRFLFASPWKCRAPHAFLDGTFCLHVSWLSPAFPPRFAHRPAQRPRPPHQRPPRHRAKKLPSAIPTKTRSAGESNSAGSPHSTPCSRRSRRVSAISGSLVAAGRSFRAGNFLLLWALFALPPDSPPSSTPAMSPSPGLLHQSEDFFLIPSSPIAARSASKNSKTFPRSHDLTPRAVRAGHAFTTALEMSPMKSPSPLPASRKLLREQKFGMARPRALHEPHASGVPLVDVNSRHCRHAAARDRRQSAEILDNLSTFIRERFKYSARSSPPRKGRLTMSCYGHASHGRAYSRRVQPGVCRPLFYDPHRPRPARDEHRPANRGLFRDPVDY